MLSYDMGVVLLEIKQKFLREFSGNRNEGSNVSM